MCSLKVEFILLATYMPQLANVFKSKRGILPTATLTHWQASLEALQSPFVSSDEKLLSQLPFAGCFFLLKDVFFKIIWKSYKLL